MRRLIILPLHKSFIVCHIQSPRATCTTYFYEPTFQRSEPTIHIIFNYVRAAQDHCLYNITGWRKWDSPRCPERANQIQMAKEDGPSPDDVQGRPSDSPNLWGPMQLDPTERLDPRKPTPVPLDLNWHSGWRGSLWGSEYYVGIF